MHDCERTNYGDNMSKSHAVLTSSGAVALGLAPCLHVKIMALTRMSLMDLGFLNVTIISLLVNGLMELDLSNIGQCL